MITQEILQKLEKAYGRVGTVRLVVYGDFSGHTEVRDSASWVTVFPFENIPDLEAHLTSRALDGGGTCACDPELFNVNAAGECLWCRRPRQ